MKIFLSLLLFFSLQLYATPSTMKLENILSKASSPTDNNHQELTIEENRHGGKVLILSNKTMWEVAPQDVVITEIWIFPFPLEIQKSDNKTYPYYIVNKNSQTKILVRPLNGTYKEQSAPIEKESSPSTATEKPASQQPKQTTPLPVPTPVPD